MVRPVVRLSIITCIALACAGAVALAADVDGQPTEREFREALEGNAAAQCRLPGVDAERPEWMRYQTLERSRTGAWRRNLKLADPDKRVPGADAGQTISPEGTVQVDAAQRRWVPGYKPRTPEQKAAYDAWLSDTRGVQTRLGRTPAGQRLLDVALGNPESAVARDDEAIQHHVTVLPAGGKVIDLATAEPVAETPKQKGPAKNRHRSGMDWDEYELLKDLAADGPETPEGQDAQVFAGRAPTVIENFDGIAAAGGVPPDPVIAVSSNFLLEAVNSRFRVWDIAQDPPVPAIPEISFNTLFSSFSNCLGSFDPYVDFDEENERFVLISQTILGNGDSYLCVAASRTPNPAGSWNTFAFRSDINTPAQSLDFPKMAIGLDAVYITGNNFLDGGNFAEIHVWALDKAELYSATPPANLTVADATLSTTFFTAYPAQLNGFRTGDWPAPGTPMYLMSNSGSTNRVWTWEDPFNQGPAIFDDFASIFLGSPPNAPEMGGGSGNLNDTNTGEWAGLEYRNGQLYAARSVFCNIDGGSSEACVDWVRVDVSGASAVLLDQQQGGRYGSAGDYRYYPDVAVDRNGNLAIGYTKSSLTTFTEVWVTGREFGDAAGTLQAEELVVAGTGEYTDGVGCGGSCDRWGDYSSMVVDPDGCRFWYVGEYSNGGNSAWRTRLGSFQFDSCSVDSALNLNKAIYTCGDDVIVTVTDSIAIPAATVAAAVTITTSTGDTENTMAGDWLGTDCVGSDCSTWTATFATSGAAGASDDGVINVADGGSIDFVYDDPHVEHTDQMRSATVDCETALEDGGFLIDGGCEAGDGTEQYRDYLDAGEYIAYTFGVFNPTTSPVLTDVQATLTVTGAAASAGLVTVFNPTVQIGTINQGTVNAAVFHLYIDPAVDSPTYRLTDLTFEVSITSPGDGYTTPQLISQMQVVQGDDNIVELSQCWNFEGGDQGWQNDNYVFSYESFPVTVNTIQAPWTRGGGCGSETRDDYPEMTCDVNGTSAFKLNPTAGSCNNFPQSGSTLVDDILFSPIFAPANTGNAPNGQPWQYTWRFAEWFYRSDMEVAADTPSSAWGHFWEDDYQGVATPAENEVDTLYSLFNGYFFYANQDWDSATPWDENAPPANYDGIGFPITVSGEASPGLQWRWAFEIFDADFGAAPTDTAATEGMSIDDMNLVYDQYHAVEQTGVCADTDVGGVVSFDQFTQGDCPTDVLSIRVLDGNAGSVTVTVTSTAGGDSETVVLSGTAPYFTADLTYSTIGGAIADDGVLYVTPTDTVQVSYDDANPVATSTATIGIDCTGGNVVVDGLAGLSDNGDGDDYADTNETASIAIRLLNNGTQDLTNVVARIETDDPDIDCILKDTAFFGTIPAGGGTSINDLLTDAFRFKVANTANCTGNPPVPPTVTFDVYISADTIDGPQAPQTLQLTLDLDDLPGTSTATENFDVQPGGWVHQVGPGDDNGVVVGAAGLECGPYVDDWFWRATGGNANGAYFLWEDPADNFPTGVYRDLNDAVLLSPVYKIGATSTTLSFDHEYKFADASGLRADGARVDFSVNGGAWQKLTSLPYDGPLINNTYCNPLCNGDNLGAPQSCFSENADNGENVFNQLSNAIQNWTNVNGVVGSLNVGDTVQFRWRVGSMNSQAGFPTLLFTDGGYGLDNVSVTNVLTSVCDTNVNPDTGCGVVFNSAGNLVEICGDGDAIVEPTEVWNVDVTVKNVGSSTAVNTTAELAVNGGSGVAATISGNPGMFGDLAPDDSATDTFGFTVDAGAVCVDDLVFDVVNLMDNAMAYAGASPAFAVQIGQVLGTEVAAQDVDPLTAEGALESSQLLPALGAATPAGLATLEYTFDYSNPAPTENATQQFNLNGVTNADAESTFVPSLTVPAGTAISATLDWSSISYGGGGGTVTNCTQIDLITPNLTVVPIKALGVADASPYDVLSTYNGANGGAGQYRIRLTERQGGGCNGSAGLAGGVLSVTGTAGSGNWTDNVQVSLFDGTSATVVKAFGVADANPYDVTAIYDAGGPGTYEIRIDENGAGGVAEISATTLTVDAVECDAGCTGGCTDPFPVDPQNLTISKSGSDLVLSFDDSGTTGATWNVYRATQPNTALWGSPIATGVTDEDGGTPGIQWTDGGAGTPGQDYYYRVTETTCQGESPL